MISLMQYIEEAEKKDYVPFFWMTDENQFYTNEFNELIRTKVSKVRTREQVVDLVKKWYCYNDEILQNMLSNIDNFISSIDKIRDDYKQSFYATVGIDNSEEISNLLGYDFEEYIINGFPYELICRMKY